MKLKEMLVRYLNEIQVKNKDKKFICHASTWLHQKRFLDFENYEMKEVKQPKSSSGNWYDELELS